MEKKIISDSISEMYRKYIIKIILSNRNYYYLFWGTDLENDDCDYLLLNNLGNIVAFPRISDLLMHINRLDYLMDGKNAKEWAKLYRLNKAYVTFDWGELIIMLNNKESFYELEHSNGISIIDFFNLFSDYAKQSKSKDLMKFYNDTDLNTFIDWLYMKFFWDQSDKAYISKLSKKLDQLSFVKIIETIKSMFRLFIQNIIVISYPRS